MAVLGVMQLSDIAELYEDEDEEDLMATGTGPT